MSPCCAYARPGHTVRFRYLEWKIQSVNLEVLQYVLHSPAAALARARRPRRYVSPAYAYIRYAIRRTHRAADSPRRGRAESSRPTRPDTAVYPVQLFCWEFRPMFSLLLVTATGIWVVSTALAAGTECVVTSDCHCPSNGVKPATDCLRQCIAACSKGGTGATVRFPPGKYLTGALNLTSNMILQIDEGAEILGSLDAADYPLVPALPGYGITRDGGVPASHNLVRHQALISGWNISGTTIQGKGIINGQGQVLGKDGKSWYTRTRTYGRPRLVEPMFCSACNRWTSPAEFCVLDPPPIRV